MRPPPCPAWLAPVLRQTRWMTQPCSTQHGGETGRIDGDASAPLYVHSNTYMSNTCAQQHAAHVDTCPQRTTHLPCLRMSVMGATLLALAVKGLAMLASPGHTS